MSFIFMRIKNHFLINAVSVILNLKQRPEATRKGMAQVWQDTELQDTHLLKFSIRQNV